MIFRITVTMNWHFKKTLVKCGPDIISSNTLSAFAIYLFIYLVSGWDFFLIAQAAPMGYPPLGSSQTRTLQRVPSVAGDRKSVV